MGKQTAQAKKVCWLAVYLCLFKKYKDYVRRFHHLVGHLDMIQLFLTCLIAMIKPNRIGINDHFTQVCALFFSKLVIKATQVSTNVWRFWQQTSKDSEHLQAKQRHWSCLAEFRMIRQGLRKPTQKQTNVSAYGVS